MMEPGESSEELRNKIRGLGSKVWKSINEGPSQQRPPAGAARPAEPYGGYLPVREHPKGTELVQRAEGRVTVRFKAAIRFWWKAIFLMIPITIAAPFVGAAIGVWMGYADQSRRYQLGDYSGFDLGAASFGGGLVATILMIILAIIIFVVTRPWVTLYADRKHIRVGSMLFDRNHFGGMRIGYEIDTTGGLLKNDFHDLDIGLQGLRLTYGLWGEDLPYLVNKYHANEIVLWLNMMIAETAAPVVTPVAQSGERTQRFE